MTNIFALTVEYTRIMPLVVEIVIQTDIALIVEYGIVQFVIDINVLTTEMVTVLNRIVHQGFIVLSADIYVMGTINMAH